MDNPHFIVLFKHIVQLIKDSRRPGVAFCQLKRIVTTSFGRQWADFFSVALPKLQLVHFKKGRPRNLTWESFSRHCRPSGRPKSWLSLSPKKASAGWDDETHKDLRTSCCFFRLLNFIQQEHHAAFLGSQTSSNFGCSQENIVLSHQGPFQRIRARRPPRKPRPVRFVVLHSSR